MSFFMESSRLSWFSLWRIRNHALMRTKVQKGLSVLKYLCIFVVPPLFIKFPLWRILILSFLSDSNLIFCELSEHANCCTIISFDFFPRELDEVQQHDKEVTQQAIETENELNAALKESEKNASLLAEYHELYELQRRRLENQICK